MAEPKKRNIKKVVVKGGGGAAGSGSGGGAREEAQGRGRSCGRRRLRRACRQQESAKKDSGCESRPSHSGRDYTRGGIVLAFPLC